MSNELEKVITNQIQESAAIQQNADKIYNIDTAQTVNVYQTIQTNSPIDLGLPDPQNEFNYDYYHLIVTGEEIDSAIITVPKDRALSDGYTEEHIKNQFSSLAPEVITSLCQYPVLVTAECSDYYAKASEGQYAYVGRIKKLRTEKNGIKFKLALEQNKRIPLQTICDLSFELNLHSMDLAITELNRSHWAIKPVNLIQELVEAGINVSGSIF